MFKKSKCIPLILIAIIGCAGQNQIRSNKQSPLEMAKKYSADKSGKALLVWINDDLVLEDYQNDSIPEKRYSIAEVSTLLSGLMVLTAADDGLLELDEPVSKTISEWKNDPQKVKITISQLLHLTSGLDAGNYKSYPTIREAITAPLIHPPGEQFDYGPLAFQVFGLLINRKIGLEYLKNRILKPLKIKGGYWITAQEVSQYDNITMFPRFFDGANLTAHEFGRIGQLLLQKGKWNGETIINDLRSLTEPTPASPGYGLGVWLNAKVSMESDSLFLNNLPEDIMLLRGEYNNKKLICDEAPTDLYMAAGRSNQRLYVIPSKNMVIVRLGQANMTWSDAEFLALLLQ